MREFEENLPESQATEPRVAPVVQAHRIAEGQLVNVTLLDAQQDRIECGAVIA